MNDINDVIDIVVKNTGQPEALVEKVIRGMFHDVQEFTSKKKGMNIQIPQVGTFVFRANAIPNYTTKTKSTLAYWISRLFIGQHKGLEKTINAANNNINHCFTSLERVAHIKQEYINSHAKYKPQTKVYLESDCESDLLRIQEYIALLKAQLFPEINGSDAQDDVPEL